MSHPSDRTPEDLRPALVPKAVREFLSTESSGAVVLFAATVVALLWANSPWSSGYTSLWATDFQLSLGTFSLHLDLHQLVNDGLMAIFFFVMGLEIKRELVEGELRDPRTAALPAIAAAGGMIVPALLFVLFTSGTGGSHGWGIPMATDIAFALGVVAILGRRLPSGLKLFLLTLAIVDDIGAIAVIAIFYSSSVDLGALAWAVGGLVLIVAARRLGISTMLVYDPVALAVWYFTHESGIHATIAGVALGLLTPAHPIGARQVTREWVADLDDEPTAELVDVMTLLARRTVSAAERFVHHLHPFTSFVVIPLFALANAGVGIDTGAITGDGARVALAVVVGLVVGKVLGIVAFTRVAMRLRVGRLPEGMDGRHLVGLAAVAGIGFTVSLFVADLAYPGHAELADAAKLGILAASLIAAVIGGGSLYLISRRARPS
jgi:NhaA family Na+:H+ antiporter